MILPIYLYGSPVLRVETEDFDAANYPGLQQLIADMFETMENADGVGLAAPQVGLPLRLFTVDLTPLEDEFPAGTPLKRVFINPHIYERDGEEEKMKEGCLSLPGLNEEVLRPGRIRIRYQDENLQEHDQEIEGYLARVIQHEYDHVDGIMFVDRISPLRKNLIKSKLAAFAKGKHNAAYRCKLGK